MKYLVQFVFFIAMATILSATLMAQKANDSSKPQFDAELAKKLGADEYGMKNYIFVILKTGPKDSDFKGKERDDVFAGHMANIERLGGEGKLALAGPFGQNDKAYRGLFIFNVATVEEAEKLIQTDPAVKAGILIAEFTPWYGSAALMMVPELHKKVQKKSF